MSTGMIVTDAIVFVIGVLLVYVWNSFVRPWLEDKHMIEIADVVVKAAESLYGAGHGEEKLDFCLKQIEDHYDIDIDEERIHSAIESAWCALNLSQMQAGVKTMNSANG